MPSSFLKSILQIWGSSSRVALGVGLTPGASRLFFQRGCTSDGYAIPKISDGRKLAMLAVRAAPGAPETLSRGRGLHPPTFWKGHQGHRGRLKYAPSLHIVVIQGGFRGNAEMLKSLITNSNYRALGAAGALLEKMRLACKNLNADGAGFVFSPASIKEVSSGTQHTTSIPPTDT
jgi:hypothetical protein